MPGVKLGFNRFHRIWSFSCRSSSLNSTPGAPETKSRRPASDGRLVFPTGELLLPLGHIGGSFSTSMAPWHLHSQVAVSFSRQLLMLIAGYQAAPNSQLKISKFPRARLNPIPSVRPACLEAPDEAWGFSNDTRKLCQQDWSKSVYPVENGVFVAPAGASGCRRKPNLLLWLRAESGLSHTGR
jgi:hypothetical protein